MKNKHRILVVDDEENIRLGFSTILTKWNYKVLVAKDGEDALNVFNNAFCDLVTTDKNKNQVFLGKGVFEEK